MNKTGVILSTIGALIVGFLVGQRVHLDRDVDSAKPVPSAAPDASVERYKIQVGNAAVTGSPTAKVTIVEFSDYQCPFCSRVEPTLEKLKRSYGKDLRVAFRHNPLPFPKISELPGLPCYCGKNGCLETWASGRAFEADYARHTQEELKADAIMAKVRAGDRLAGLIWDRYVDRVARGLSVVVNTLDPDVLVMGGGISNIDELYAALPGKLAGYTFSTVFETPIRKAVHGDSSGVRGAAWLWKEI